MKSLFNPDSPFMRFFGKVFDVLIISILWFFCSLPLITIGATTTSVYYATLKIVRDEERGPIKDFFHSFKRNFKAATKIWLILLLIMGLLLGNAWFYLIYLKVEGNLKIAVSVIILAGLFFWLAIFIYVFALLARFDNTVKRMLGNAALFAIVKFGYTVLMIVMDAAIIYLSLKFMPILGVPFAAWFNSYWLHVMFEKISK